MKKSKKVVQSSSEKYRRIIFEGIRYQHTKESVMEAIKTYQPYYYTTSPVYFEVKIDCRKFQFDPDIGLDTTAALALMDFLALSTHECIEIYEEGVIPRPIFPIYRREEFGRYILFMYLERSENSESFDKYALHVDRSSCASDPVQYRPILTCSKCDDSPDGYVPIYQSRGKNQKITDMKSVCITEQEVNGDNEINR